MPCRLRSVLEVIAQRGCKVMCAAGKNSIACETAGVKDRIGEISNKTAGVAALETQSKVHRSFDGLLMGNFDQHNCALV